MDFKTYQKLAHRTALYPKIGKSFVYPVLGLGGEVGELLNKVKKIFRDKKGRLTKEAKLAIKGELGDILWYVAEIATAFNFSLEEVAKENIEKLKDRAKRGKIKGEGDKR